MSHIDQDVLALLALGDVTADPHEAEHLAACPSCRAELAELTRVVTLARPTESGARGRLVTPPPELWDRIAAEIGADDSAARAGRTAGPAPAAVRAGHPTPAGSSGVRRRRPRLGHGRGRIAALVAIAGVAGIVVGLGVAISVLPRGAEPDREAVVSSATLEALPGWSGRDGTAEIERSADGRLTLVVEVPAETSETAADAPLREVWMMRPDRDGLVSVGFLDGHHGRFTVPTGVSPSRYPVVDVSAEADDGNPAHSGNSVVRGTLTADRS